MIAINDLKSITPAAFAASPDPRVSARYEFIPSEPIVGELLDRGWTIRSAYQNAKDDPFASHRIVFDVPGAQAKYEVGDVHPTATLFNSHNRSRRLSFTIGFFRTICSNQAQVSVLSHDFSRVHLLGWHGVDFATIIEKTLNEMAPFPGLFAKMRERELSPSERTRFGKEVLSIRAYHEPQFSCLFNDRDASSVLEPFRAIDRGNDLWHVFNVAQENVITRGRRGGINEVRKNREVNLALWNHACSYLNN